MAALIEQLEQLEAIVALLSQAGGSDEETNLSKSRQQLSAGLFGRVLGWPGTAFLDAEEATAARTMKLLADVAEIFGDEDMKNLGESLAADPTDSLELYELGYQLIEQQLPRAAATILKRAFDASPTPKILEELVVALEDAGLNRDAARVLRDNLVCVELSSMCRYLLCYDSIMSGDLETARNHQDTLIKVLSPDQASLGQNISSMIRRADAIANYKPNALDLYDLRGWHYVINNSILLHQSPYGRQSMRGRYAFVTDSENIVKETIDKLKAVLSSWNVPFSKVWFVEGRDNEIFAHCVASTLNIPIIERWNSTQGSSEPGIICVYDFNDTCEQDPSVRAKLLRSNPNQFLFAHAMSWVTQTTYLSPDFVGYLYQMNTSAWGAHMRLESNPNPAAEDKHIVGETEPDDAAPATIAERVSKITIKYQSEAEGEDDDGLLVNDVADILALATLIETMDEDDRIAPLSVSGQARSRFRIGGPVDSARFF